jgi:hypothetical protein
LFGYKSQGVTDAGLARPTASPTTTAPSTIEPGPWSAVLPAQLPLKFDFKSRYRPLVPRIEFDAPLRDLRQLLDQEAIKALGFDEAAVRNPVMSGRGARFLSSLRF